MKALSKNVFGETIKTCSDDPKTGFYRNGCCDTGSDDHGKHTVCAIMTEDFLQFSKAMGNDLSTPMPQFGFPGLKTGDRWCLCVLRWKEGVFTRSSNQKCKNKISPAIGRVIHFMPLSIRLSY